MDNRKHTLDLILKVVLVIIPKQMTLPGGCGSPL